MGKDILMVSDSECQPFLGESLEIPEGKVGIYDDRGLVAIVNECSTFGNANEPLPEVPYLYFIQADIQNGPIKIGYTENIERRVSMLKSQSAVPLRILKVIEGGHRDEVKIHKMFNDARLHHEWFNPVPELIDFIDNIETFYDCWK